MKPQLSLFYVCRQTVRHYDLVLYLSADCETTSELLFYADFVCGTINEPREHSVKFLT
jgi:hypothetical protein